MALLRTEAEKRAGRKHRQKSRQKQRMPRVVAKASALTPEVKLKTVHVSELSTLAMATGGEKHWRVVIDGNYMIEWVGFAWIMIREATLEDRARYPRVVRSNA